MPKPSPDLTQSRTLRTCDLEQAAVLFASGINPLRSEWRVERLYFVFPESEKARSVLSDLVSGALRLDPSLVIGGYRRARQQLFEAKQDRAKATRANAGL
jgi:hypothetical protein